MTDRRSGFTLVELMLAMAFIGVLLIVMITAVIHISNLYSKGIAMKSVNQAGRELGASLTRDATNAASVATPFIAPDAIGAGGLGRLCLGGFSYLWSPAASLLDASAATYDDGTPIVMARIADNSGAFCAKTGERYPTAVSKTSSVEMLPSENGDFAIHSLMVTRIPPFGAAVAGEVLYNIQYTIGTNDNGSIDDSDYSCKPPSIENINNNFNFCSVNNFEIIVRAG